MYVLIFVRSLDCERITAAHVRTAHTYCEVYAHFHKSVVLCRSFHRSASPVRLVLFALEEENDPVDPFNDSCFFSL